MKAHLPASLPSSSRCPIHKLLLYQRLGQPSVIGVHEEPCEPASRGSRTWCWWGCSRTTARGMSHFFAEIRYSAARSCGLGCEAHSRIVVGVGGTSRTHKTPHNLPHRGGYMHARRNTRRTSSIVKNAIPVPLLSAVVSRQLKCQSGNRLCHV